MANLVDKKIADRYHVQEFLGRGGMAEVYKVWDPRRMISLAMKVLLEDLAIDKDFMKRFRREAKTLEHLQHRNIVRIYGLETVGSLAYMLMDLIEGPSLKKIIFQSGQSLSNKNILNIMQGLCAALNYAHAEGFVHCDIKPGNVLIDGQGNVYLADFGIAQVTTQTATMVGVGTPAYMAPEQVREEVPTKETDIYALGILLYEMATGGERPFTGTLANHTGTVSEKVRWEQLNASPPSPKEYNPSISPQLERVIMKCLEKAPEDRYRTAIELWNDLVSALGQYSGEGVDLTEIPEEIRPVKPIPPEPRKLSNKYIGIIFAVLMAFVLLAVVFTNGSDSPSPSPSNNSPPALSEEVSPDQPEADSSVSSQPKPTSTKSPTRAPTKLPSSTATESSVAPAPRGELRIAFALGDFEEADIFVINVDTGKRTRITNNGYEDKSPSFSPDNSKLVYHSNRDKGWQLYVYDFATKKETRITNFDGQAKFPSWSPVLGDERIAFEGRKGQPGRFDINVWIVNSDGSGMEQLTFSNADNRPNWLGDGSAIIFGRATRDSNQNGRISSDDYLDIYTVDPKNKNIEEILKTNNVDEFQFGSSPDGKQIVYCAVTGDANGDGNVNLADSRNIYLTNLNGSNQSVIRLTDAEIYSPDFSPDGRYISFNIWFNDDQSAIWIYDLLTDQITKLTDRGSYYHPEWSH